MLNMLEIPHRHLSSVNVNWVGVPSRSMSCSCAMSRRESPAFTCRVVRSPSEVTNVNDNLPVRQRYGTRVTLLLVSVVQHVHVEILKVNQKFSRKEDYHSTSQKLDTRHSRFHASPTHYSISDLPLPSYSYSSVPEYPVKGAGSTVYMLVSKSSARLL